MKNPALLFAVALAIGVGAAAITSSLLMSPPLVPEQAGSPAPSAGGGPTLSVDESEFIRRLQELREENASLRDRLSSLEQSPGQDLRRPAGTPVSRAEFEAFKQEVRALLQGMVKAEPDAEVFRNRVADLMDSIRKEEAVEKFKAMQTEDSGRLEERVQQWDEWLGFNEYQRGEFRLLLSTRDLQHAEVLRMWSEGADDQVIGEAKQQNEEQYQAAMAALLTPPQLEVFRERYKR